MFDHFLPAQTGETPQLVQPPWACFLIYNVGLTTAGHLSRGGGRRQPARKGRDSSWGLSWRRGSYTRPGRGVCSNGTGRGVWPNLGLSSLPRGFRSSHARAWPPSLIPQPDHRHSEPHFGGNWCFPSDLTPSCLARLGASSALGGAQAMGPTASSWGWFSQSHLLFSWRARIWHGYVSGDDRK